VITADLTTPEMFSASQVVIELH